MPGSVNSKEKAEDDSDARTPSAESGTNRKKADGITAVLKQGKGDYTYVSCFKLLPNPVNLYINSFDLSFFSQKKNERPDQSQHSAFKRLDRMPLPLSRLCIKATS